MPIDEAATTPNALKQIQVDLAELRKHVKEWETADKVFNNLTHFKEWLPRMQWAFKDKAQIYLLYNTLPPNLQKQLLKVEWTKHCVAGHATKGSLQTMEDWILSWRHVRPRIETALSTLYSGELKQGLRTWYEKIQGVGEDAFRPNKYMWSLAQRLLVAQAFIKGCRYHKAHWHLLQDALEGMDERAIDKHLNHCRNVFEESKGCENQHPYVTLQHKYKYNKWLRRSCTHHSRPSTGTPRGWPPATCLGPRSPAASTTSRTTCSSISKLTQVKRKLIH